MQPQYKFAGIGSRSTTMHVLSLMTDIAKELCSHGWMLRSGGAEGADTAFEWGCDQVRGRKEIFLPWPRFNKNKSPFHNVSQEALDIAAKIHPAWAKLTRGARLLHGRNIYQVAGNNLNDPVNLVVCWTKYGLKTGGTRTAIVYAEQLNIPVINLYHQQWSFKKIMQKLGIQHE